jgi:hypothetical protein
MQMRRCPNSGQVYRGGELRRSGGRPTALAGATAENPQIRRHNWREGGVPAAHRAKSRRFRRCEPGAPRHCRGDERSQCLSLQERAIKEGSNGEAAGRWPFSAQR